MRQMLREVSQLAGFKRAVIAKQLSSGPASDRWLLETDQGRMVLTRDHPLASSLMLDREFQFAMLKAIAGSDLGPAPVLWDADSRVLLLHYVDGASITAGQFCQHKNLSRVAGLLRRLHSLDIEDLGRTTTLQDKIHGYAQLVNTAQADALQTEADLLLSRWPTPNGRGVLCHNDVNHGNVILRERLRLIDWDYAAPGDRCFDLATVVSYHQLGDDAARDLLKAYSGEESPSGYARLKAYCRIYELVVNLWHLCIAAKSEPCTGHKQSD